MKITIETKINLGKKSPYKKEIAITINVIEDSNKNRPLGACNYLADLGHQDAYCASANFVQCISFSHENSILVQYASPCPGMIFA